MLIRVLMVTAIVIMMKKYSWQVTNTLNYAFDLDDHAHDFNILLGQETWYTESMNLDNEYRKFTDGKFLD